MDLFQDLSVKSNFLNNDLILTKSDLLNYEKNINIINTPDLYIPLVCTLHALEISKTITGTETLENKESNRIESTQKELDKIYNDKNIFTYYDHRLAMSFATLSLKFGTLIINDSQVVSKSYPDFWSDLEKASFIIEL